MAKCGERTGWINGTAKPDEQNPTEMGPLAPPLGGGGLELVEGG